MRSIAIGRVLILTVDKGSLAFSSVMGIQQDLNLVGQQYALLGTILYVGILVGEVSTILGFCNDCKDATDTYQVPVNRAIQRFPVAKMLGFLVITWVSPTSVRLVLHLQASGQVLMVQGAIVMCHAACTTWSGLMVSFAVSSRELKGAPLTRPGRSILLGPHGKVRPTLQFIDNLDVSETSN